MIDERFDDARRREDAAIRTEQKLNDFLERYAENQKNSEVWRRSIETRLVPLESMASTFTTPAKIIGGCLVLMATPFLGILGWDIGRALTGLLHRLFMGGPPR